MTWPEGQVDQEAGAATASLRKGLVPRV